MAMGKGMPVTTTWMGTVQAWAEGVAGRPVRIRIQWERSREAGEPENWAAGESAWVRDYLQQKSVGT